MPRPTVTIVIPIHNEAGFLVGAVERLTAELAAVDADCDIILAENGSTDGTAGLAADLAARRGDLTLIRLPDPDYGAAMRSGFRAAGGEWAVNFDIDYFSGEFLQQALGLAAGADIVLASKRATGSDDRRSRFRRMGTMVFNRILRWLFRSSVSDTHGMKLIRREVITSVLPLVTSTKDLFDTELVLRAERDGFRIAELPVVVEEQRDARSSYLKRVPRTLRGLVGIRFRMWQEDRR
ncbi:MAG: glycosyltransferase family 2 protein [Actinobacteria bacterium]|nr:glycosyltransferase family 2 protein [Actinomycetota bacterium]MBU1865873.1 glycosyltransferase family 2 protein [Actinomycetota bacterium]